MERFFLNGFAIRNSFFLFFLIFILAGCGGLHDDGDNGDHLSIVFCGDVLLDRGLRPVIQKHGTEYLFQNVQEYFGNADAVVVNLECPISSSSTPINKKYIFRADTITARGLRNSGITHCCLGNNHSVDQGVGGLVETYSHLKGNGIVPIGFGMDSLERRLPAIIRKNGLEVAVFSATPLLIENYASIDSVPGIWNAGIDDICRTIRIFRKQNPDTKIVLSIHWGVEFFKSPSLHQRMEARRLLAAGTDVIVGHHPHVIQPLEIIDGKPVFFSLGNFVFDQSRPEGREGVMSVISFHKDTLKYKTVEYDIVINRPLIR